MKYLITIIGLLATTSVLAQKCNRPNEVFIKLSQTDDINLIQNDSVFHLQNGTETFIRTSKFYKIDEAEYLNIEFKSLTELRHKEMEIRQCEVSKAVKKVYVDIDINSIFNNIYLVYLNNDSIYKFKVRWIDAIE